MDNSSPKIYTEFLPISRADMEARGWDQLDFVVVGGDAYVDHPSFGTAIISRLLEAEGYKVGVLAQPRYTDCEDFKRFGKPKYGFFIGGGNVDSMVSHYSVAKIPRAEDEYSPGGKGGARPDRSATVYTRLAKQAYPDLPVILGGLEASLRRFAHYDYWLDTVLPSIAEDSGADIISFGMGEHQTVEIARRLAAGEPVESITDVDGTCYMTDFDHLPERYVECAGFKKVASDKTAYAKACRIQMDNQDVVSGQIIEQKQKFVGQIMTSKSPIRSMTDLDNSVIEAATAKAIACGNPKLIEKVNLEKDVDSLKIAKATHTQTRYTMQDMVLKKLPSQIETTQEILRNQLEDMRTYNANKFESTDKSAFHITVAGKEYTDKAEGGMALIDTAKKQMIEHNGMMIGKFKGFPIKVNYDFMQKKGTLTLAGKQNHMVDISTDPHSMIKMMDTQLDRIATHIIPRLETKLTELQQDLTRTTEEMNKPFPKEEELQEKQKRLDELNEELLADMGDDRKPSDQIEEEKSAVATEKSDLPIEDARKFNMKNFTMEQQEDGKYTLHGDVENNRGGFENMCIRANLTKEEVGQWAAKYGVEVKDESKTIKGAVGHKKEVIEKKGDTPTLGDTEVKREQNAAK